jgi:hypothetical protein
MLHYVPFVKEKLKEWFKSLSNVLLLAVGWGPWGKEMCDVQDVN